MHNWRHICVVRIKGAPPHIGVELRSSATQDSTVQNFSFSFVKISRGDENYVPLKFFYTSTAVEAADLLRLTSALCIGLQMRVAEEIKVKHIQEVLDTYDVFRRLEIVEGIQRKPHPEKANRKGQDKWVSLGDVAKVK